MPSRLPRTLVFAALAALFTCLAVAVPAWSDSAVNTDDSSPERSGAGVGKVITEPGGSEYIRGEVVVTVAGEGQPRTVEIPANSDPRQAAKWLERQPGVTSATPNFVARISAWTPNDPGVNPGQAGPVGGWAAKQWNFLPCGPDCHPGDTDAGPYSRGGMNVLRGWRRLRQAGRAGARGIRVAVLDTGVAYRNWRRVFRRDPDLAPHRFLPGYDFVKNNRFPVDRHGHGTHIASTIAQTTNNGFGLTGIAYRSRIIPVRVMNAQGAGTAANIAKGIRWAANHGARVAVMSLNFPCGEKVPAVSQALRYAHRKGVVLVGSAGNRSAQTCPSLPATAPQVISVGGTTEAGCVGNYSFRDEAIELAAPGGGSGYPDCPWTSHNRSILQLSLISDWFGDERQRFVIRPHWTGTSMAAAHVAGAAAALLASGVLNGKGGAGPVRRRLAGTARLPDWAAGDPASGFGAGIIDLGRALNRNVSAGL